MIINNHSTTLTVSRKNFEKEINEQRFLGSVAKETYQRASEATKAALIKIIKCYLENSEPEPIELGDLNLLWDSNLETIRLTDNELIKPDTYLQLMHYRPLVGSQQESIVYLVRIFPDGINSTLEDSNIHA